MVSIDNKIPLKDKYVLSYAEVETLTGLRRKTIWKYSNENKFDFPSRRTLTDGRVCFITTEILHWLETRPKV